MNKNFIVNSYKAEFRMDKYRDDLIEKYDSEVKIDGLKDITDDYVNALIENENAYGVVNVSIDKFKYDLMNKFECYLMEYEREKLDKVVYDLMNKFVNDLKHSLFICLNEIEKENTDEIVNVLIDKFKDILIEYDLMDKFEDYLMDKFEDYVNSLMEDEGGNENENENQR